MNLSHPRSPLGDSPHGVMPFDPIAATGFTTRARVSAIQRVRASCSAQQRVRSGDAASSAWNSGSSRSSTSIKSDRTAVSRPLLAERQHSLVVELPGDAGTAVADAVRPNQVLANLPELFRQHRIDAVVVGVGA